MKKIILVVLLFPMYVYASVIPFENGTIELDNFSEDTEEIKFKEKRYYYNTYEERIVDKGYLEPNFDLPWGPNNPDKDIISNYYDTDIYDYKIVNSYYESELNNKAYQIIGNFGQKIYAIEIEVHDKYDVSEIEIYSNNVKVNFCIESNDEVIGLIDENFRDTVDLSTISMVIKPSVPLDTKDLEILIYSKNIVNHNVKLFYKLADNTQTYLNVNTNANNLYFSNSLKNAGIYKITKERWYHVYDHQVVKTNNYVTDGDNLMYDDMIEKYVYRWFDLVYIYDDISKLDNIVEKTNFPVNSLDIVYDNDIFYKTGTYEVNIYINDYHIIITYEVVYDEVIDNPELNEEDIKDEEIEYGKLTKDGIITRDDELFDNISNYSASIKVENETKYLNYNIVSETNYSNDKIEKINNVDDTFVDDKMKQIRQYYYFGMLIFIIVCIVIIYVYIRNKSKNVEYI